MRNTWPISEKMGQVFFSKIVDSSSVKYVGSGRKKINSKFLSITSLKFIEELFSDRKKSSPSTELCAETTLSMNMNNIQQRFEEMEERLRFLEQQVLTSPLANAENFEKNLFGSINN